MLRKSYQHLFQQLLIWTVSWMLISFFLTNGIEYPERFFRRITPTFIGMVLIIVINYKILLPKFYFNKRNLIFVTSGLLLTIGVFLLIYSEIMPWAEWVRPKRSPFSESSDGMGKGRFSSRLIFGLLMTLIMPLLIAFLGSTLIEISRYANRKEKEVIKTEKAKLATELKFLKSQINPHFLFNTLNNIYTLTVIKSDKAPENLLRLSDMLRYMLYDTDNSHVPLKKEIDYLKNYVQLMGLKDSRGLNVTLELDESQPDLPVAPLLFIPLVENAYKHSKIEDLQKGFIHIQLKTEKKQIAFKVENSVSTTNFTKDKAGGIGLQNIRQRLELLYPERHELAINETADRYVVKLKLKES